MPIHYPLRFAATGLLLLLCCLQASPQLINIPGRQTTSLNGKWNYIIDPYETGYYNFHSEVYDQHNAKATGAFYNNYHAKNKSELVEYDFDRSPAMNIPGDWNTQSRELLYYEGTVWFKRSFDYALKPGRRLFVHFGAVNYQAHVYLNGTKLGVHEGGFTPFLYEITDIVKPAGNYLVLKVDNRRQKEGVPTLNTDWWNYGGITRDVTLVEEPPVFIRDYTIGLKKGTGNMLTCTVALDHPAPATVTVEIPELKINWSYGMPPSGSATFDIPAEGIRYWSPESPKLYRVLIRTGTETMTDEIGFRTIETNGPDILLNGKSIYLRGISIHEEYKGRRANSAADAAALLGLAKELGCNYVRLAHYPHNEHMIRLADKMGLLVWEEIPVYWTIDFENMATRDNASAQLTAMVNRDKNRASVIIWSVANETPASAARNLFLQHLVGLARSLDPARLVSAALLTRSENGVNIVDDPMGAYFDIVAFNQYRGWYGGDLKTAPEAKWTTPYNKPVVVSEFGGDAKQGLHGSREERWTEEYQEYLYRQNLAMIGNMPNIRGMSPWILTDFRSPRRVLPGVQDGFNRKGLVSTEGKKKKAFFVLQEYYRIISKRYQENKQ